MSLFSVQLERHSIGGLIQNPQVFPDVEGFLSEKDYYVEPHNVIFSCLRNLILSGEKPDKVILAQKINNLGISFKEGINIFDYIDSISLAPITPEATKKACQEIVKLKFLRELENTSEEIKDHVNKSTNQELDKTVTEVDAIYSETIKSFVLKDDVQDLFGTMVDDIEETGNNPVEEIGIPTPFFEFNRLYGGLRNGNVYIIVSRPKQGKTTFLNYLIHEISKLQKIPCLILDTEMSTREIKFRTAASITGVPLWFLESGNWRKNQQYFDKIRNEKFKNIASQYKVHHIAVGNMPTDRVASIVRRWHMAYVGRGNRCVVAYDYLKLTGEKLGQNWAEHQALGEKVDKFKKLSEELEFPFISAGQMNRSGENIGRQASDVSDDGSVIAISDRLSWFSTFVGIFRRKTQDEFVMDTPASGSHKLIELFARYQGRDAAGHQDWMQRRMPDGEVKWVRNYINFNIHNFQVEERGSLRDSINRQNSTISLQDDNTENNVTL